MGLVTIRNTQEAELLKHIYNNIQEALNTVCENVSSNNVPELNKDFSKVKLKVNPSVIESKLREVQAQTKDTEKKLKNLQNEIILDTDRIQGVQEKLIKAKLAVRFSRAITQTKICFHEGQYIGNIFNTRTKKYKLFEYDQDDPDLSAKMWENMKKICVD